MNWIGNSKRVMKERMAAGKDGACLLIWQQGDDVVMEYFLMLQAG